MYRKFIFQMLSKSKQKSAKTMKYGKIHVTCMLGSLFFDLLENPPIGSIAKELNFAH